MEVGTITDASCRCCDVNCIRDHLLCCAEQGFFPNPNNSIPPEHCYFCLSNNVVVIISISSNIRTHLFAIAKPFDSWSSFATTNLAAVVISFDCCSSFIPSSFTPNYLAAVVIPFNCCSSCYSSFTSTHLAPIATPFNCCSSFTPTQLAAIVTSFFFQFTFCHLATNNCKTTYRGCSAANQSFIGSLCWIPRCRHN